MADKKISELPLLNAVSGSTIIVPIVHDGTTAKLNLSQLAQYSSQWSAKTGSANTFTGNQTVNGNLILNGNGVISGNVEVGGMITAQQYNVTYVSSSIQYQSGSTEFGDTADDTHIFTGTLILNGLAIGTAELMAFTGSQIGKDLTLSILTSSIDAHILAQATQTGSQDLVNLRISSVTGSINTTTSSFNSVFLGISSVTGAMNTQSSSQDLVNLGISSVTGSLIGIANGLMAFTQSVNVVSGSYATTGSNTFRGNQIITGSLSISGGQFNVITGSGQLTSSLTFTHNITAPNDGNAILELRHNNDLYNDDIAIKLKADFAGAYLDYEEDGTPYSVLSVQSFANKNVYIHQDTRLLFSNLTVDENLIVKQNTQITGSLIALGGITGSLLSTNGVVSSSNQLFELNAFTGSVIGQTNTISTFTSSVNFTTQSLNTQTGSQDLVNLGLSTATGSLIGITNGLMAFTAALDSTYATDTQLYQLYQATASIHSTTASINTQTGSQDLVNRGISSVTGSINTTTSSFDGVFLRISSTTSSINTTTSSFNNVFLGISSVTGAMNTQSSSQDLVNLGISSVTGSLIGITNGLMAFTAALDSTYATDAQLYQLYQATASIQFATQSLNTQTGSQDIVNFNISVVTSSIDSHILKQATQTGSQDLVNLGISTFTGSLRSEVNLIEAYTASLKNAFTIDNNNDVYFSGKITTQEVHTTYTTSSVLFQSGSTKFGNSSDDIHEFTGSKFEVFNSDTSGTMYAVVKNNRARNAAVKTTTTNGSFIAGTSIGTDTFQYQIYDEVEGVNRVTINSQGGTTLQGAVSASQTLRVTGKTQIGTSTVDTSLGSKTKLSVVGDGSVNAGASQGSLFVGAGNDGGDTGLPINMGTAGATMMLLASINTSTGTATNSATYIVRFYFDGNNAPTTTYLGGSSDFVTFGVTPSNTLAVSGSSSGNKSYAWFINKFGA